MASWRTNLLVAIVLLVIDANPTTGQSSTFDVYGYYLVESCNGVPNRVDAANFTDVCADGCGRSSSVWKSGGAGCDVGFADYKQVISELFNGTAYLLIEAFTNDSNCGTLAASSSLVASGSCEQVIMYVKSWGFAVYETIQVESDGTVVARYFTDDACTSSINGSAELISEAIDVQDINVSAEDLNESSCDESGYRWTYYASTLSSSSTSTSASSTGDASSPVTTTTTKSSSKTGVIVGVAGGVVAVVLVIVGLLWYRRRVQTKSSNHDFGYHGTFSLTREGNPQVQGQPGLWNDDVITAKRISRRNVQILKLISRGAFGKVYEGLFDGTRVAVKTLPPETRGKIRHVNNFLAEAKLTAAMDHPRVISIVGVAWNSLTDFKYEATNHPVGIGRHKATVALHVCHALTYLHSLSPPVIHRDLKSRNILLNNALEAKVTDFGISREGLDQTMTAGVGTSLWMAPEVMLGERYDTKADIFSFGVVLSELDLQTLPYAQANDQNHDTNGKRLPDAIILQKVAMGNLRVNFSNSSP